MFGLLERYKRRQGSHRDALHGEIVAVLAQAPIEHGHVVLQLVRACAALVVLSFQLNHASYLPLDDR